MTPDTATRERIERIAKEYTPGSYGGFEPSAVNQMLQLALTALCEEMEREKWQPIDGAPRDGTRIICWGPKLAVAECEWRKDGRFLAAGWYRSNQLPQVEPTHWQPLPQPPAT